MAPGGGLPLNDGEDEQELLGIVIFDGEGLDADLACFRSIAAPARARRGFGSQFAVGTCGWALGRLHSRRGPVSRVDCRGLTNHSTDSLASSGPFTPGPLPQWTEQIQLEDNDPPTAQLSSPSSPQTSPVNLLPPPGQVTPKKGTAKKGTKRGNGAVHSDQSKPAVPTTPEATAVKTPSTRPTRSSKRVADHSPKPAVPSPATRPKRERSSSRLNETMETEDRRKRQKTRSAAPTAGPSSSPIELVGTTLPKSPRATTTRRKAATNHSIANARPNPSS